MLDEGVSMSVISTLEGEDTTEQEMVADMRRYRPIIAHDETDAILTFTSTMTLQTCDGCKHYAPAQGVPRAYGHCAWIDDHSDDEPGAFVQCEYGYGVSVGPKFGCIKWEVKV